MSRKYHVSATINGDDFGPEDWAVLQTRGTVTDFVDKAARERQAVQIRDEMARQIPANAALFKPAR